MINIYAFYTSTPHWRGHLYVPEILFLGTWKFSSRNEAANTPTYRPFGSTKKEVIFLNWWATTSFSRTLITKTASYLVVHMSRLRWLVAAEAPVQSQGSPCGIYGRRSGTGTGFASSASVLSRQQGSTDAHIQSSVNRRMAAVPRDLNLTPTVTIDPQQRHYRQVNTKSVVDCCISCTLWNAPKLAYS